MACYTANLVARENILSMTLKSDTISRYLCAAADTSIPANMMNSCLDLTGKQSRFIKDILHEIKRWEVMPNRREPITKDIISYIVNKGEGMKKSNPHNIYAVLGDWLILGLQSGFRRKEWAQDRTHLSKYRDIQRNVDGSPAAFTMSDWDFRGKKNRRLNQSSNTQIANADSVDIKWRFQKNNDNGQVITYTKDTNNPSFCYVQAALRIRTRFLKLKHNHDEPLAIFLDTIKTKKIVKYIDDTHICRILQEAANSVYKITDKNDLKRFTSHSIRVGACVPLHSQNMTTEDIKFRLRWRSDAFRMYLRNITQLADRHQDAIRNA